MPKKTKPCISVLEEGGDESQMSLIPKKVGRIPFSESPTHGSAAEHSGNSAPPSPAAQ